MDPLSRAKAFLIKSQEEDGSWGSGDPFVCARALLAICDAIPDGTLARGLKYIEGRQVPDGHFAPATKMYSDATGTAYSLIALNRFDYGKASLPVSRGILWLLENQNEDGSWGMNKTKKAYTTSFCLRALHTFYLSGIRRFTKGLEYTSGYLKDLCFEEEPVSHVYAPILNLKRVGCLEGMLEEKFREYARPASKRAMDSGSIADVAYLLGTLKALGEKDIAPVLEKRLEYAMNVDGGFGKSHGSPSDPNWTALALLSLQDRL